MSSKLDSEKSRKRKSRSDEIGTSFCLSKRDKNEEEIDKGGKEKGGVRAAAAIDGNDDDDDDDDDDHQHNDDRTEKIDIDVEEVLMINNRNVKNLDIHIFSDLRGLTNSEEKTAKYYAAQFFCFGADNSCRKFSKIFDKKFEKRSRTSNSKSNEIISFSTTSFSSSKSSNSTTSMDFERQE